jgi:hypothetical protein
MSLYPRGILVRSRQSSCPCVDQAPEHDEHERVAARMAWFAQNLVMPDAAVATIGWMSFVQNILSDNVAITVDENVLDCLEGPWNEVVWGSMKTFVDVNRLDPTLKGT